MRESNQPGMVPLPPRRSESDAVRHTPSQQAPAGSTQPLAPYPDGIAHGGPQAYAPGGTVPSTPFIPQYGPIPPTDDGGYPRNMYQPPSYPMPRYLYGDGYAPTGMTPPTHGTTNSKSGFALAIASLVTGILGAVSCCLGISDFAFLMLAAFLGIIGIVLAAVSKHLGYTGTLRTSGFVISIVALSFSAVILVTCFGCAASLDRTTNEIVR